jgi:single-strand DNA-binding protein
LQTRSRHSATQNKSTRTEAINTTSSTKGPAMSGFDINQLTISGNLTRDPELRHLQSSQSVCSIRIAHNERYRDAAGEWTDRAAYFDVTIWGGLGEWIAKNVASGEKVVVAGRLRWREWETKEGDKRQAVDITADSVVPVPGRTDTPAASQAAADAEQPAKTAPANAKAANAKAAA